MKLFSRILSVILLFWIGLFWTNVSAGVISDIFSTTGDPSVPYCQWDDKVKCTVKWGVEETESIGSVITDQKASEYIQNVTSYILWFMAIVAVLYIIYAGFNILTGAWDEEKVKKSKSIITYVIMGIIIMFLAYSIVRFIFGILDSGNNTPPIAPTTQVLIYS